MLRSLEEMVDESYDTKNKSLIEFLGAFESFGETQKSSGKNEILLSPTESTTNPSLAHPSKKGKL